MFNPFNEAHKHVFENHNVIVPTQRKTKERTTIVVINSQSRDNIDELTSNYSVSLTEELHNVNRIKIQQYFVPNTQYNFSNTTLSYLSEEASVPRALKDLDFSNDNLTSSVIFNKGQYMDEPVVCDISSTSSNFMLDQVNSYFSHLKTSTNDVYYDSLSHEISNQLNNLTTNVKTLLLINPVNKKYSFYTNFESSLSTYNADFFAIRFNSELARMLGTTENKISAPRGEGEVTFQIVNSSTSNLKYTLTGINTNFTTQLEVGDDVYFELNTSTVSAPFRMKIVSIANDTSCIAEINSTTSPSDLLSKSAYYWIGRYTFEYVSNQNAYPYKILNIKGNFSGKVLHSSSDTIQQSFALLPTFDVFTCSDVIMEKYFYPSIGTVSKLFFEIRNPDGTLYDTQNQDNMFVLEITTFKQRPGYNDF
jgi:hypothetical protein